ncbi:protein FAR1-RELATED SEQUENCE 3-like [Lotus japonicus]|uniref:protein FAR1-RELATED SEQUENCE 3-like n=1 Tax=Lotus japonicus TaxID=34305 RepID=UPI00258B1C59|nr:protein FAR1-RELATED SEQUENCE 3-like [Lotus japonicus]
MGILCRHILVIFQAKGVVQIPSHFIMERWTKDANRGLEDTYNDNDLGEKSDTLKILRRVHVQREASFLAGLAEESEEAYNFIISEMKQTHKSAAAMKTSEGVALLESSEKNVNQVCSSEQVSEPPQLTIGNPHVSQTKGRKKDGGKMTQNGRFKSGLEVSLNKSVVKRKACHECGEHGHNSRTCKKRNQND